jgi:hypothetical protein
VSTAVTVALITTAPDGSMTVPVIWPVSVWPNELTLVNVNTNVIAMSSVKTFADRPQDERNVCFIANLTFFFFA